MDDQTTAAIRAYFAKLGLADNIADIYLALYSHGPQTLSSLARTSGVERTRIYRLLDELIHANLIESETQYARGLIKAAPIANLQLLILQREQELTALKDELGLIQQVLGRNQLASPATRVQTYEGPDAIRTMAWHMLDATEPVFSYVWQPLNDYLGGTFMTQWANEAVKRGLQRRILSNVELKANHIRGTSYSIINQNAFPITHNADVYGGVVAYYQWHAGDVYGFELHNRPIAQAQRLLLGRLWQESAHNEPTAPSSAQP